MKFERREEKRRREEEDATHLLEGREGTGGGSIFDEALRADFKGPGCLLGPAVALLGEGEVGESSFLFPLPLDEDCDGRTQLVSFDSSRDDRAREMPDSLLPVLARRLES